MTQSIRVEELTPPHNQLAKHAVHIHKFGGSSLANTQCIKRVVDIIRRHCQLNDFIVVSANGDTTDALFVLYQQAIEQNTELFTSIDQLKEMQSQLISSLLNKSSAARLIEYLCADIKKLTKWLTTDPQQHQTNMLAFGELWSARLLSAVLNEQVCASYYLDAREFLTIDNEKACKVETVSSTAAFAQKTQAGKLAIITGYICQDAEGNTCTLGRNGSDYSATIMAALSGASNVTLWTDVDGIYSADPRVVPLARKLHRLPNGVAKELGRLGNPVLHAKTLQPLTNHDTHLHVASSFEPTGSGTEIGKFGQIAKQELSVTYLNDLIQAKSNSLIGDLGNQAILEFSPICADTQEGFIVISQEQQKTFTAWLGAQQIEALITPVSIIATVGHKVIYHGNVQARFKRSLKH